MLYLDEIVMQAPAPQAAVAVAAPAQYSYTYKQDMGTTPATAFGNASYLFRN